MNSSPPHDGSYKSLFSHPEMVESLIRDFVPEDWVHEVDFTTLEKQNGSYVTDDLRERHDDVIWEFRGQYIKNAMHFFSTSIVKRSSSILATIASLVCFAMNTSIVLARTDFLTTHPDTVAFQVSIADVE
jgi:hypothetical protein